ncbi:hypothetical protein ACFE04_016886 [Oxalis oulophora]
MACSSSSSSIVVVRYQYQRCCLIHKLIRHSLLASSTLTIRPRFGSISASLSTTTTTSSSSFSWDDVVRVSHPDYSPYDDPSDLTPFFHQINLCNRASEKQSEFLPFVIDDHIVGFLHNSFARNLRPYEDVFIFPQDDSYGGSFGICAKLHPNLKTPHDRTAAVNDVITQLAQQGLIPGLRRELLSVTSSFGGPVFFSLERTAAPYFGIKVYGIHMNGYVERNGQKFLWVGKRSQEKQTYPGMLDHLVAGGLPHGIPCGENVVKECEEEAGIPRALSTRAVPVGAVSYIDINGHSYKRDVLFCYDLHLPEEFVPENQDGEVEGFKLIPVTCVANIIRRSQFYKSNCSLVIIDFLFRHGYIKPEYNRYLDLLQSLRRGDCS